MNDPIRGRLDYDVMRNPLPPKDNSTFLHGRLDLARGLSAIAVLLDHAQTTFIARIRGPESVDSLVASIAGRHAVLIFFLLSGHLITTSIVNNIKRNGTFDLHQYVAARLTRIYPPLIGSIILCVVVWALLFSLDLPGAYRPFGLAGDLFSWRSYFTLSGPEIFTALTMQGGLLQVNGPLWSLYVEFQMYILAMAVGVWWRPDYFSRCWAGLLGLLAITLLLDQPLMVGIWALGAATALLSRYRRLWMSLGILAAVAILVLECRHTRWDGVLKEAVLDPTLLAFGFTYSVLLFFRSERLRFPRAAVRTADFSYSLYIIHAPLLLLMLALTQDWTGHSLQRAMVVYFAAIPAILFAAKVFASLVENQDLYKRWLSRGSLPRLHVVAQPLAESPVLADPVFPPDVGWDGAVAAMP